MHAIVRWGVANRLDQITCPVLVVAADKDYTPLENKLAYARQIKRSEVVVIEDSRHATPVDQPDKFNNTLNSFLYARGAL